MLVGLALVGVGTFFAQATATGFVGRAATTDRGSASGIYLACYFLGGLVGTAVLGQVFDRLGWAACVAGVGAGPRRWRRGSPRGLKMAAARQGLVTGRGRIVSGTTACLPLSRPASAVKSAGARPCRSTRPAIRPSEITPKAVWLRRRELLAGAAALGLAGSIAEPAAAAALAAAKSPLSTDEPPTPLEDITSYNNYYEFGTDKDDPARNADTLTTQPWTVKVDGLVAKPATISSRTS